MDRLPRVFRALLLVLPERFRAAHREEMRYVLESYAEDRPRWWRGIMWLRAGLDVVVVGVGLRIDSMMGRTGEGGTMMDGILQDVVFAVRALRRRPGFTVVAVSTLAIGIGVNTGIFSVVHGVLLSPLPYSNADRIGIVWHEFGEGAQNLPALHISDLRDYRDRSRLFEDFTVATGREWILGDESSAEIVDVGVVESGFFEFFGASPFLGRAFTTDEDIVGAAQVVMLSHRLWQRRFGADPEIVGRMIDAAGTTMEVTGVLPEWFRLHLPAEAFRLRDAEVWTNMRLDATRLPPRNFTGYTGFGRLREGVTFAQGQEELEALEAQLKAEHPEHAASKLEARIVPLLDDVVKGAESTLLLLLGAVGFVLVIACANVANLVIVRGQGRSHEYSLRSALGAGRGSLLRLSFVESAILSVAGAVLGTMLAVGGLALLAAMGPESVPRLDEVEIDTTVLLFAAALTVLSAVLFGALPALRTTVNDPARVLNSDTRATSGREQRRFRDALIIGEVAASLVLLIGTGLMVRSFAALTTVDPGYATEGALTFRVSLPPGGFPDRETRDAFQAQFFAAVGGFAGVEGVSATSQLPLTGAGPLLPFAYNEATAQNWESVTADQRFVSPGFFDAIGAKLVAGRGFTSSDVAERLRIVVDERLAEMAFPGESAVGRMLQINSNETDERFRYAQIVGVVSHLRLHDVSRPHLTQVYWPTGGQSRFSVVVRTSADPADLVAPVRAELARLAPGAPMEDVLTISELVDSSLAPDRLALALMMGFGLVALLLASVGIYGTLSYAVAQRTREIGVRMALGQSPYAVRRVVLLEGGRLVALALVLGLVVASVLSRFVSSVLYEVQPLDPLTYLTTSLVLACAAALACWIPARRATRVDPLTALRAD